jgi:hypothetical protein
MADFQPGELVRVVTSHHKIVPKGSIVKVVREHTHSRYVGGSGWGYGTYSSGPWVDFTPLINRGGKSNVYTWNKQKFAKL